jgi:protein-L-isoaspartate(D-aspartate) O-methyltransferase
MAWRSHGSTNESLVDCLAENGLITSDRVKQAMKKVSFQLAT